MKELEAQNFLYLIIDLLSISVPLVFSFERRIRFYKLYPKLIPSILFTTLFFIIWDYFFTKNAIWGFNPKYLIGIEFYGLPLEEILFFICIPYASIFTYQVVDFFFSERISKILNLETIFLKIFFLLSILLSIIFWYKAYTLGTFLCLAFTILLYKSFRFEQFFMKLVFAYLFILLPFCLTNGILTGTGLESPVVWYNDSENLGIKFISIPIEDFFYGFNLLFINLLVFSLLDKQRSSLRALHVT
jgi:lycopene cyclase domain-containing protein